MQLKLSFHQPLETMRQPRSGSDNIDYDGSGLMIPSDQSDHDDECSDLESDSDYESDNGGDCFDNQGKPLKIQWTGPGRRVPIVEFDVEGFFNERKDLKKIGQQHHLTCKVSGDAQIMREIFDAHGFHEVHLTNRYYNIAWTGNHSKPQFIRKMAEFQKINHFPRTNEITRKDLLFKNIKRKQRQKGKEHFDFIPMSFVLPGHYKSFCSHFKKDKGPYIVKPVGLSRGRGVYLIDHPKEVHKKGERGIGKTIVCKYIPNPLIVNGYKFDLRLYVALTSFDPLVIYVYKEGLTRFATVKYDMDMHELNERCMHLTNYSINMWSQDYIKNSDSEVENFGSKWSLGALLRYLKENGIDTTAIMMQIEDVVIKTLLAVETKVCAACKRFQTLPNNCFELFGFDILVDENLKPWLLEVNLSPSLGCDTPLDMKIKSNMLCDLLNLVGVTCYNPYMQGIRPLRSKTILGKLYSRIQKSVGHHYYSICRDAIQIALSRHQARKRLRAMLIQEKNINSKSSTMSKAKIQKATNQWATLKPKEVEMIRRVREEESRKQGWMRIFPSAHTWDTYKCFMDFPTTNNLVLHQRLYPERHLLMTAGRKLGTSAAANTGKTANDVAVEMSAQRAGDGQQPSGSYLQTLERVEHYEGPLEIVPPPRFKEKRSSDIGTQPDPDSDDILDTASPDILGNQKQDNLLPTTGLHERSGYQTSTSASSASSSNSAHVQMDVEKSGNQELKGAKADTDKPVMIQLWAAKHKFDVVGMLEKGYTLSRVQARTAFSMYLMQLKKRLLQVVDETLPSEEMAILDELRDQVLRFLKRAILYLPLPYYVEPPRENLSHFEQRQIVAKQLANYLRMYTRDTIQMRSEEEKAQVDGRRVRRYQFYRHVDERKFDQFVYHAEEKELEDILSTFSKFNESIDIFLKVDGAYGIDRLCDPKIGRIFS